MPWSVEDFVLHHACLLDAAFVPLYILLIVLSLFSVAVPFLKNVSSHGKTRKPTDQSSMINFFTNGNQFLVPKRYFKHFYATGLVSLPCCLALASFPTTLDRGASSSPHCWILLVIHLVRRTYECQYVHQWSREGKMHILGYLLGVSHYLWLPMMFVRLPCWNLNWRSPTRLRMKNYLNRPD